MPISLQTLVPELRSLFRAKLNSNFTAIANAIDALTGRADGVDAVIPTLRSRNLVINPAFRINQDVVAGTVTLTAGQFGHDQWKAGAGGCTYTFAQDGEVVRLTITAGTLKQTIDGKDLASGNHCLSWEGTAQGRINSGAYAGGPVIGAATALTNLDIEFGVGSVTRVKLEPGSIPSPFRLDSEASELAACQWFYEKGYASIWQGQTAGYRSGVYVSFNVGKRATPTMAQTMVENNGYDAPVISYVDRQGFRYEAISNTTTTDGRVSSTWTASARL